MSRGVSYFMLLLVSHCFPGWFSGASAALRRDASRSIKMRHQMTHRMSIADAMLEARTKVDLHCHHDPRSSSSAGVVRRRLLALPVPVVPTVAT